MMATGRSMRQAVARLRTAWRRPRRRSPGPALACGLIGAAGWIARVHLRALRDAGHQLLFAMDPSDAGIAILDEFFPDALFLTSEQEVEAFLDEPRDPPLAFLGVCSPDYLHPSHVELALRHGADAVCEKPLVMDPADLEALERIERETGRRIFPIMQHRFNPAVLELERALRRAPNRRKAVVEVTYVAHRGPWYLASWRGNPDQSAGLAMDIGIHFFDLLTWLFGEVVESAVHLSAPRALGGYLELDRARVRWFLSIDRADLPAELAERGAHNLRSLRIDGRRIELTRGMQDLHLETYRRIAAGQGLRIPDVRPGLELAGAIHRQAPRFDPERAHERTAARIERHGQPG